MPYPAGPQRQVGKREYHDKRILVAAGTFREAERIRESLDLPQARLVSTYHRGGGRGFTADLLLIDRKSVATENLQVLLPCTIGGGRAYFIEEIR